MTSVLVTTVLALGVTAAAAPAAPPGDSPGRSPGGSPGAPGVGDPYFPLAGNGGYDVRHYGLRLSYRPRTDRLVGRATIHARARKNLSRFNLDLDGMRVRAVTVGGRRAHWSRKGGELRIRPAATLRRGHRFTAVVRYAGVPRSLPDGPGFLHTDDGALTIGQPKNASTWFPVNDHPQDKASYSFTVSVPRGLQVVANGSLRDRRRDGRWTTWRWVARAPMAPYLATVDIGRWNLRHYRAGRLEMWDAIDPDLFDPWATPRTGERFAWSGVGDQGYKRLTRTVSVPAGGAELSFWTTRVLEADWEYFAVEARPADGSTWTTLPDENGHTSRDTGVGCGVLLQLHPFLEHYQTAAEDGTCAPTGTTGAWNAASGISAGSEQWRVDLSDYAGTDVEVSLTAVSDDVYAFPGVWVDDVTLSTGEGSTSFEADGAPLDGWVVSGAPAGSSENTTDWTLITPSGNPPPLGRTVRAALDRQGEILAFLSDRFGPYPFASGGGIVDDVEGLGFALETQTRPLYSKDFFYYDDGGIGVVVHELAHQWFGDSVSIRRWRDIWLNEGFATYAEWLWSEEQGEQTAQELFDFYLSVIPPDDPFWQLVIGDPGPADVLAGPVYLRGAMTLQALRREVGDDDFFTILRRWAARNRYAWGTTGQFEQLAERVSGRRLDDLFDRWLRSPGRPEEPTTPAPEDDGSDALQRRGPGWTVPDPGGARPR